MRSVYRLRIFLHQTLFIRSCPQPFIILSPPAKLSTMTFQAAERLPFSGPYRSRPRSFILPSHSTEPPQPSQAVQSLQPIQPAQSLQPPQSLQSPQQSNALQFTSWPCPEYFYGYSPFNTVTHQTSSSELWHAPHDDTSKRKQMNPLAVQSVTYNRVTGPTPNSQDGPATPKKAAVREVCINLARYHE